MWRQVKSLIGNSTVPVSTSFLDVVEHFYTCSGEVQAPFFLQGLCLRQIRMRVTNPLRAGPQFAEAFFSNAKTFKAAKSPKFARACRKASRKTPDPKPKIWLNRGTMRFLHIFVYFLRLRFGPGGPRLSSAQISIWTDISCEVGVGIHELTWKGKYRNA